MKQVVVFCDRLIGHDRFHLSAELVAVTGEWPDGAPVLDLGPEVFVRELTWLGDEDSPELAAMLDEARGSAEAIASVINGGAVVLHKKVATGDSEVVMGWLRKRADRFGLERDHFVQVVWQILAARHADLVRRRSDLVGDQAIMKTEIVNGADGGGDAGG